MKEEPAITCLLSVESRRNKRLHTTEQVQRKRINKENKTPPGRRKQKKRKR